MFEPIKEQLPSSIEYNIPSVPMTRPLFRSLLFLFVFLFCIPGCSSQAANSDAIKDVTDSTAENTALSTDSGTKSVQESQTHEPPAVKPIEKPDPITIWPCDCLPEAYLSGLKIEEPFVRSDEAAAAFKIIPQDMQESSVYTASQWTYVLAAPFPTLQDTISFSLLKNTWLKINQTANFVSTLLVSESTYDVFSRLWGKPDTDGVKVMPASDLLQTAWEEDKAWAIIPFEEIDPRWKIIRINDVSPLDSDFNPAQYPLTVRFGLVQTETGSRELAQNQLTGLAMPAANFFPEKLTSLILTGTTALARYTALRMEEKGVLYPASDIVDLLKDADITHISNEAPFYESCPPAEPVRVEQRFCSDPSYFELLQYIDADVIELTGNHILDWGTEPFLYTLQMYRDHDLPYYGGGSNITEAEQTLTLQDGSQAITFIGCSPAGPQSVWAGVNTPGSNPCTDGWMETQIDSALEAGSIPVVTFQHIEVEDYTPHSSQRIDFQEAAKQGAIIVSGSQSHFAQTMTFVGDHFVHYGLGNLFFDQMYGENPHEFVDKHYFYDGKYIATELVTLMLEDYAKPRLMEPSERRAFLQTIFERCSWETVFSADKE